MSVLLTLASVCPTFTTQAVQAMGRRYALYMMPFRSSIISFVSVCCWIENLPTAPLSPVKSTVGCCSPGSSTRSCNPVTVEIQHLVKQFLKTHDDMANELFLMGKSHQFGPKWLQWSTCAGSCFQKPELGQNKILPMEHVLCPSRISKLIIKLENMEGSHISSAKPGKTSPLQPQLRRIFNCSTKYFTSTYF